MGFSPLLPAAAQLLKRSTSLQEMHTTDYIAWRNELELLRKEAEELRDRIVALETSAARMAAAAAAAATPSSSTGDDAERRVQGALDAARTLLDRTDAALARYDPSSSNKATLDMAAQELCQCGLILTGGELPDYFGPLSERAEGPFLQFWESAENLFALMEAICKDSQIDYGLWCTHLDHLRREVKALEQGVEPLIRAATFDPHAGDPYQHFVLSAIEDGHNLQARAAQAIAMFEARREWLTRAADLKGRPPILPCMSGAGPPMPYEEKTERLWLYKWLTAEAYGGLAGGTIYSGIASAIDRERERELVNMEAYSVGPTHASEIIKRQSELNMARLRRYFKQAPMTVDEEIFCARMRRLHFCMFHATDAGAHLIHRHQLLSLTRLQATLKLSGLQEAERSAGKKPKDRKEERSKHLRVPPKVKSTDRNLILKGDADFTFFRLDISTSRQPVLKTRYGSTAFLADAECLFKIGWISLHDQVYPFKEEKTRRVAHAGNNVRILVDNGADSLVRWRLAYGGGIARADPGRALHGLPCYLVDTSFRDEIFYGADVLEGVLLSLVRELRRVAGLHLDCDVGRLLNGPVDFTDGIAYRTGALRCVEIVDLRAVMSAFFRVEAKIPCCLRFEIVDKDTFFDPKLYTEPYDLVEPVPAIMFHELGDGRYYIADPSSSSPLAVETHVIGLLAGHSYDLWDDETRGRADSNKAADLRPAARYWNVLWYLALWRVPSRIALNITKARCPGIDWYNYGIQGLKDPRKEPFSASVFTASERSEIREVIRVKLLALGLTLADINSLDEIASENQEGD